ncbi:hypothetical protein [Halostreptopolyspora alba]|uniref:Uncharacterized protein n=1 Tax=Halostreptopolyspora alba TaxID=2487137 RepID=A0A3N0EH39_9ACTN|nr:hypothetical protein EFW17_03805 [Nocardiopsaceae bacterium YIM 96095]
MRIRSLTCVVAAITGIAAWSAVTGPALGAAAIVVYDCASVDYNSVTAEATGYQCVRGDGGAPGTVGFVLVDQERDEEYVCDDASTAPDPDGGLVVSGTGCELDISP